MNLIKTLLILLNLEIAFGNESIQTYSKETDIRQLERPISVSKRNSAYKRLPGWKVFYGKRSSDENFGDELGMLRLHETHDLNNLIDSARDRVRPTGIESIDNLDISDSVNLSDAFDSEDSKDRTLLEHSYENEPQNVNLLDLVRESNNQKEDLNSDSYVKENNDGFQDSKRAGWNAIYGKRMPGWFVGYGKRGVDLSDDAEKRAATWLAMYGKRSPRWLATYGKRAPQWLATYGKRAPHWLATYGKRAPQWLATYGKRAPQWLATYGKRSPERLASYDRRAPQWLATYGKRAPQWLATYGKRAPRWLATYGKRSDSSVVDAFIRHMSDLHRQSFGTNEQVNAMPKQPPGIDAESDKRGSRGWAALYG